MWRWRTSIMRLHGKAGGERLLIVFHSGDAAENITLDVTDTSIADAKGFAPILGGTPVRLEGTRVSLQLAPYSLAIYQVQ